MKYSIILVLVIILTSCSTERKYDKVKWLEHSDIGQYPNRNGMVNDLVSNFELKGLSYIQLTNLIGEPEKMLTEDSNDICYEILTEYGFDIDPVFTKTLIIELNEDSTVVDYKINEWKKGKQ